MHRHERFQIEYLDKIENLLKVLTPYLLTKYREMPQETKQLNTSIAEFLKVNCCFSLQSVMVKLVHHCVGNYG